jgi:hypothetical protein
MKSVILAGGTGRRLDPVTAWWSSMLPAGRCRSRRSPASHALYAQWGSGTFSRYPVRLASFAPMASKALSNALAMASRRLPPCLAWKC